MMERRTESTVSDLLDAHRGECVECDGLGAVGDEVIRRLAVAPDVDVARLRAGVRSTLASELALRRDRLWWRRCTAVLAVAAIPLPFVLAWAAYAVQWIHHAIAAYLPVAAATLASASYFAALLLIIGATYAAIPVLLARREPPRAWGVAWETR